MRRIINHDLSSGYVTVKELTLSSTTGVNKETYINLPSSKNTETERADTQSELLSGIVSSVGQLTKIVNSMNEQKNIDETNLTIKVVDVDIDDIKMERQFISVNSDTLTIPNNTLIKDIKLDIEKSFPKDTQFILFFNNTILATIKVIDTSVTTYEMTLNKVISYTSGMGNNMNVEVFTDPGDPYTDNWESAKAILHITFGFPR